MGFIIEWTGDELWNLLNLPNSELYRLYGQFYSGNKKDRQANIRRKANHYRKLYRLGRIQMPSREVPYDSDKEPEAISKRRMRAGKNLAGKALDTTVITVPVEHLEYHEQLQAALETDGRVDKATFTSGEHTGYIKNAENEIEYTEPMKSARAKFEVSFNTEPDWPVPSRVESIKLQRKEPLKEKDHKTCMVFPDVQIPFQSEEALQIALSVMQEIKPDKVVFLGDLLDLSAWGRFEMQPEWATATQDALIQAHQLLASIRKTLPMAEIDVLAGNHEERMPKTLLRNAQAAYGLKRANQLDGWPVMSIPYLLALDDIDVNYHAGYPANRLWLNRNLQIRHGNATRKKGGSARTQIAAEKVSTIFGHDHRISSSITTVNDFDGGKQIHSYGSGCLCRIDGHVPSYHQGREVDGTPIQQLEDWQRGFLIATYDDENFHVEQVPIGLDDKAMFRGRVYG
jgi:hypothetical protein